jgi:dTDP-4-amino-4,6-dideoxygalactose transaminase
MIVKYLDLRKQFKDEELWIALKKQFETCQFIMGPEVEWFESNFAKLCQASYALGVNSGTDAIFLALKALDIGSGDEVITVPNSFVASVGAIMATGAKPVFVDVGPDYNIDAALIEQAITKKTKAILPVHLTGNPAEMDKIMEISKRRSLYVVEDAAQAVGAAIEGQPVGSFGDAGCFSLHPLKNLNVCGDGGVLTTSSQEVYNKLKLLRNHGLKNRDEIEFFGYNSRLDTIQATIANHVMKNLNSITEARRNNAQVYDSELKNLYDFITLPPRRDSVYQVYHTYVIKTKNRDKLAKYLNGLGVETKIHYPIPIHIQKPCRELGYKKGDFPVCEEDCRTIISLPIHQYLKLEDLSYVIDSVHRFYRQ